MPHTSADLGSGSMSASRDVRHECESTSAPFPRKEEGREEGEQRGREATANIIIRLLTKRLGQGLPEGIRSSISGLPLSVLEDLSEALLDFTSVADLQAWLEAR
ncbi:DUF4351 domain-containing protein [Nostoc sp. ChiQUE01b]|uniref:DUF4351 domain-containing protein n=1 Tax=Nostoc sp. ChiQUE01b TaxID=3075376 RepID=UPI002AD558FE|nr:DUF4351 domain-containing protein [Nostoc sp. ChiQUE01b]MDZ8261407.1 DUF4351 domain-containing protein [Nostoc sp. ChiQUE01b]